MLIFGSSLCQFWALPFAFDWYFICRNIEALIMKFHGVCIQALNALTHMSLVSCFPVFLPRIVAGIAGDSKASSPGRTSGGPH